MRPPKTLLAALLVLLAGCGAGTPPSPTDTAPETSANPETPTPTATPTPTPVPAECHVPTPVPNPERITHRIGVVNQFEEPRNVTVELVGDGRSDIKSKTFEGTWVPFTISEPGTYALRVAVDGERRLNTTVEPPYGEYPTIADSVTSVVLERNGSVSVETSWEAVAPTEVCSR